MIKIRVAGIAAVLEPSTAGTTTTRTTNFIGAALRTYCDDGLGDRR